MEKAQTHDRPSYLATFFAVDKTPEGILLRTVLATTAILIAAALFFHNPMLLIPAAILMAVLHRYHMKRVRAETGSATESAIPEAAIPN